MPAGEGGAEHEREREREHLTLVSTIPASLIAASLLAVAAEDAAKSGEGLAGVSAAPVHCDSERVGGGGVEWGGVPVQGRGYAQGVRADPESCTVRLLSISGARRMSLWR